MLARYVLRRFVRMLPVVVGMTTLVFFMIHLVPGDPVRTLLGPRAPIEVVERLSAQWGLDQPLLDQYTAFMGRLLQGDLGFSFTHNVAVGELIGPRFAPTLLLLLFGAVFVIVIAVPLAMAAALNEGRWPDHIVRVVPMVGLGMPAFWLGILLLIFVALNVSWIPVGGYGSTWPEHFVALILPSLTVAITMAPFTIRSLRASMIEVMDADFIATAQAKGISRRRVIIGHGLRNAMIPTITVLGVNIGWLVGNTLIVEKVFAIPGLGATMIDGVLRRDFGVVQALALIFGLLVVLVNLLTDVARAALDPRVELS